VGVINRRNAVAGWAVWKLAKRILRRKLRQKTGTLLRLRKGRGGK
jgi:hypothetical protein